MIAPGPLLADGLAVRARGARGRHSRAAGPLPRRRSRPASSPARSRSPRRRGSFDPADVDATVALDGDDAVLSGTKRFVVEGDAVDELVVVARIAGSPGADGVRAVVVPAAALTTHARARVRRQPPARARRPRRRARRRATACSATPTRRPPTALRRALEEATVCARARDGRHRADDLRHRRSSTRSSASSSACRSARSRRSSTSSPT